ncbi:MAG: response regulator [Oscillospiraceae bacterium]|nr:response regulator [Oscillospiraceae bacterium]
MQKLLIADCNEDFCLALAEALQGHYQVLCCGNGRDALALLRREQPRILVLEMMLPELDGITVLEHAAKEGIHPKILAFVPFLSEYIQDAAQRLGIGYLMRKPCEMTALVARILDLDRFSPAPAPKRSPEERCSHLLLSLGYSPSHNGYLYIIDCIQMLHQDSGLALTKEVYPAVAKKHGRKWRRIERSIRSATEAAWERGDRELWHSYFPNSTKRPSNSAFLFQLLQLISSTAE